MLIAEEVIQTMQYPDDMEDEYIADDQLKTFEEMMGEFGDENEEFGTMEDLEELEGYLNETPFQENEMREPDGWNESPHPNDTNGNGNNSSYYLKYIEEKDNEILLLKEEKEAIEIEREDLMSKVNELTVLFAFICISYL